MKALLCLLIILFSSCQQKNTLEEKMSKLRKYDLKIKSCLKSLKLNGDQYCSFSENFTLPKSLGACKERIEKLGFKYLEVKESRAQNLEFYFSTKKALVDYDKKLVYLKESTQLSDCVHELIHLYQYQSEVSIALSQRRNLNKEIRALLNKEVDELAKLEEAGKVEEVLAQSKVIQEKINKVEAFNEHVDGLDEIEAYLYVYRNCKKLECTKIDQQIALSNLFRRSQYLDIKEQKIIQTQVNEILAKKRSQAFKRARKDWQMPSQIKQIRDLYQLDFKKLLSIIAKSGVNIYRIPSESNFNFNFLMEESIPIELYKQVKVIDPNKMGIIGDKVLKGIAYGKYVCTEKAKFIIINKLASKATIVHEYLHAQHAKAMPVYCGGDQRQLELKEKFEKGQMDLDEYERQILYIQALNDLAEYDVYSQMNKIIDLFKKYERLNISENFKRYALKLEGYQD